MASTGFARGSKAWGHCQRCGFRYLLSQLIHDGQIEGLQVCDECWDPKHPQEKLPTLFDPMALKNATGDMDAAVSRGVAPPVGVDPFSISWSNVRVDEDRVWRAEVVMTGVPPLDFIVTPTEEYVGTLEVSGTEVSFTEFEPGSGGSVALEAYGSDGLDRAASAAIVAEIEAVPEPTFNVSYDVDIYSFGMFDMTVRVGVDASGGILLERDSGDAGYGIEVVLDGVLQDQWAEDFAWVRGTTIPSATPVDGSLYRLTFAAPTVGGDIEPAFIAQVSDFIVLNDGQGSNWNYVTGSGTVTLPVEVRRISDNAVVATTTLNMTFTDSSFGGYS